MRPDLVIFDCDGVLVDSEVVSNEALVRNLSRYGLDLDLQEAMHLFVGGTMKSVETKVREMGADVPGNWVDEVYDETYARLRAGVDVVAGIPALLDLLDREGIAYCVASNGSPDKMRITLGQNGLWERFDGKRFSAHELGVSKPDPDLFLIAAKEMDVAPQNAVIVEDSRSGVLAAQRAGMRCLGYVPHGNGAALQALGAELFDDMHQAPGLLGLV